MSRIKDTFDTLKSRGEKALITYLTGGDPSLAATRELVLSMARSGADIVEIGIPFSDPLADGPVIQAASLRALSAGSTVAGLLNTVRNIRRDSQVPIVLMTYYNPVMQYGLGQFTIDAVQSGVDGLIVPDLPYEESEPLRLQADQNGLDLIPLVAPTSTPARLSAICSAARGFVYCVAVTGVTGTRVQIETDLDALTREVRRHTNLPVAIGFGVSGPESAARVSGYCDGVVVGSALVKLIGEKDNDRVEELTTQLKQALAT